MIKNPERHEATHEGAVMSAAVNELVTPAGRIVPGIRIGHATDRTLGSGVTVILPDTAAIASVDIRGGSPGTRDIHLLLPEQTVTHVDALVLSGGSAFGLDAAGGVQAWLREQGRGYPVEPFRIPIVPTAILFDLRSSGEKTMCQWLSSLN